MTGDYRAQSEQVTEIQKNYTTLSKSTEELEQELNTINEQLQKTTGKLDDTSQ